MKEIRIPRTVEDIYYEAIDGERFSSKEECSKYDQTAKAVIKAKYKQLIIKSNTMYSICEACNDYQIDLVKVSNEAELHSLNMYLKMVADNGYGGVFKPVASTEIGKEFMIYYGYDDDWYEVIGTKAEFLEALAKELDKMWERKDD